MCVCVSVGFRLESHIFLDPESLNLKPSTAALRQMLAQWRGGAHSRFLCQDGNILWHCACVITCLKKHADHLKPSQKLFWLPQAWPYWPSICRAVVCSSLWKQARIMFRNNVFFRYYWNVRSEPCSWEFLFFFKYLYLIDDIIFHNWL